MLRSSLKTLYLGALFLLILACFGPPSMAEVKSAQPDLSQSSDQSLASENQISAKINQELYTARVQASVKRALRYLESQQNFDGSVGNHYKIATTSISGLAFLAHGVTSSRTEHAKFLARATNFILDSQQKNGYISDGGYSRMHGHGYAMMFLAEVYGTCQGQEDIMNREYFVDQRRVKKALNDAIRISIESQTKLGGWNYGPNNYSTFDEASITVCMVQALRAAKDAGLHVPKDIIDKAVDYIIQSYDGKGSFLYSLNHKIDRPSPALTAAGLSVIIATGEKSEKLDKITQECLVYMNRTYSYYRVPLNDNYYHYTNFYAIQAMYHLGGDNWKYWYRGFRDNMLRSEVVDDTLGYSMWASNIDYVYGTAFAALILQIPTGYLPIFQK